MPYRIQDMTKDLYLKLTKLWMINSINMTDDLRDDRVMDLLLYETPTAWYRTKNENVFFWLSSVNHGHQAEFHVLNGGGKTAAEKPEEYFPVIREIFTEFNLQRLTAAVPVCLSRVIKGAKSLHFSTEGRIRKGAFFNGKFEDVEIMGLLRDEVPARENKQRNRQRTRRKRPSGKTIGRKNKKAA